MSRRYFIKRMQIVTPPRYEILTVYEDQKVRGHDILLCVEVPVWFSQKTLPELIELHKAGCLGEPPKTVRTTRGAKW